MVCDFLDVCISVLTAPMNSLNWVTFLRNLWCTVGAFVKC